MPKMQLPKKLKPIMAETARNIVLIGGRGGGKSISVGDKCVMDAQIHGIKTACFREYQATIDDSVHALLKSEIERMDAKGFVCTDNAIRYQGVDAFKYRGMARNTEGIKSMFGFGRFWIEEAQTSSSKSINVITKTLREDASQLYWTANPRSAADPFSQRFIVPYHKKIRKDGYYRDDDHLIILINHNDNPFMPDVLERERLYDKEHMTEAMYAHVWNGEFYDEVENSIIPVKWFEAAVDAHIKLGYRPEGAKVVSHDPSDEGDDDKGICLRQGSVILDVQAAEYGDVNDGCDWALDYFEKERADHFIWDADGMGIGLKREVAAALDGRHGITYEPFHGQGTVDDPEQIYRYAEDDGRPDNELSKRRRKKNRDVFKNKRAQYWWKLRDRFYRTYEATKKGKYVDPDELISISSKIEDIDSLKAEICRIPRKKNPSGKIQIMSKQEMLDLPEPISSPNMGDSCMMSMTTPGTAVQSVQLKSVSPW